MSATLKRAKKDELQQPVIILTIEGQSEQLENRNGKKNNCMNISSGKQTKSHMRKPGHGYKSLTTRENWISSNCSIRTNHLKAKILNIQQNV